MKKIDSLERMVIKQSSEFFGLDITKKSRKREYVDARSMCMSYLRGELDLKVTYIGILFSLDHSTIVHSIDKHNSLMEIDKTYRKKFHKYFSYIVSLTPPKDERYDIESVLLYQTMPYLRHIEHKLSLKPSAAIHHAVCFLCTQLLGDFNVQTPKIYVRSDMWTPEEYEKLDYYYRKGFTKNFISARLGRSQSAVAKKIYERKERYSEV